MFVLSIATAWAAVAVIALSIGDMAMIRGALAMLANWSILTAAASVTGDQYNVPLNMTVDWLTIWVGFAPAKQLPQVMMAGSFGIGMMFHADHLFKLAIGIDVNELKHPYWWRFYYLAWGQAALMLGWECYGGGQRLFRYFGCNRGVPPVSASCSVGHPPVAKP